MNIYKVFLSDCFSFFSTDSIDDLKKIEKKDYDGIETMSFSFENEGRDNNGDITVLDTSCTLLFSKKAQNIFKNEKYIYIPQINEYCLLDAPVIDALNKEESVIEYFSGTTRLKGIRKYVFNKDMLTSVDVFSLPIVASPIFVTENFKKLYDDNSLTGLDFSLVN